MSKGRPPIVNRKLGIPNRWDGSDGDMQIRQTNLGAKFFGKIGGEWYSTFLSSEAEVIGTSGTKIGMDSSGALTVDEIKLTGKISLTSVGTQNICLGTGQTDAGNDNIAIGVNAGGSLDADSENNIFIGTDAGTAVTGSSTYANNIAIGNESLEEIDEAQQAVFIGRQAGQHLLTANYSVGIGTFAMKNQDNVSNARANYCVAVGTNAMGKCHVGNSTSQAHTPDGSTAIGFSSLFNVDAYNNTALGAYAGDAIVRGDHNICIGKSSDCGADINYGIAIGVGVVCAADTTIRIGDSSNYLLYDFGSGGAVSVTSDERIKKNVIDTDIGLDFINALRPIKYTPKNKQDYPGELFQGGVNKDALDEEIQRGEDPTTIIDGFIAQEVKQVMDNMNVTFSGWHENESSRQMLGYSMFILPLTKAVQELSAKIDTMQTEINNLKSE